MARRERVKAVRSSSDALIERIGDVRDYRSAGESYVDVIFRYPDCPESPIWEGAIPIRYRHSVVTDVEARVAEAYAACHPSQRTKWREAELAFWDTHRSESTVDRPIFEVLASDFAWVCTACQFPASTNPARRVLNLKSMGYVIATCTRLQNPCNNPSCTSAQPRRRGRGVKHILVPLPRQGGVAYETMTAELKTRIHRLLGPKDEYDGVESRFHYIDHKFPEERWLPTEERRYESGDLTDEDIRQRFQLLTNQRNQQKREACRQCAATGRRPGLFGIKFFATGSGQWPDDVPEKGAEAEAGCIGCGWYDVKAWREALQLRIDRTGRTAR